MTESRPPDDQLLEAAAAIARGEPVDWAHLPVDTDTETSTVVAQLQALEGLSLRSSPTPNSWGPFTIVGEIGHGSFGTVYRAIDPTLNLEIALKVVRPREPVSEEDFMRALSEARMLAQINHPHVVRLFQVQRLDREVGLSMELVKGRTLSSIIKTDGRLGAGDAMAIGVHLCDALAAVHEAQLIHGDIKAHNVMCAERGRTVLMDFGAGNDLKVDDEPSGRRVTGTPLYLAPELFGSARPTRQSDIYSLGVLLFHTVTDAYPIEGRTREEVARQHENDTPRRRLRDLRPDLPGAFVSVIERATARRPQDRYQSAGAFGAALRDALRGKDPVVVPWRRPVLVAAALVTLALTYGLWSVLRTPAQVANAGGATPAGVISSNSAVPYQIEAAFYRDQAGNAVRLQAGERIARDDRISLQVLSSIPTYVYVINEDERGEAYLLFPLPGQELLNPLPAKERHEVPGHLDGERVTWRVTSEGGREHFLIFASPDPPSPIFERIFARLPRPTLDRPGAPITGDLKSALRGIGGLAKAPVLPSTTGLTAEFATPLPSGEETARGIWARQLTLENPIR